MTAQDERIALLRRAKSGDSEAAEAFYVQNSGLVKMAVRRFLGRGIEYDDLFQIGSMAFVKAVRNFDLDAGVQFSTYAVPVIIGELRRHFRDTGALRVSRSIKELAAKASGARETLSNRLGREATVGEIAAELGLDAAEVAMALDSLGPVLSLSQDTSGEGEGIAATLGVDESETVIERIAVSRALERLPERERRVMALRYYNSSTQQETAKELGISQVQVSRIEKKTLSQLKKML